MITACDDLGTDHPLLTIRRGASVVLHGRTAAVLVFGAQLATGAQLAFAIRHSSGLIHAVARSSWLDRLRIPNQPVLQSDSGICDFTVAVDARHGITTGISAYDRARTLRVLADPDTGVDDLVRPGHVLPIRCADDARQCASGPWVSALDLVASAGLTPVAGVCHLVSDTGEMLLGEATYRFAARYGIPVLGA